MKTGIADAVLNDGRAERRVLQTGFGSAGRGACRYGKRIVASYPDEKNGGRADGATIPNE